MKLKIISYRIHFAFILKLFNYSGLFLINLSMYFLCIYLIIKALFFICKYIIKIIKWSIKASRLYKCAEMPSLLKESLIKKFIEFYDKIKIIKSNNNLSKVSDTLLKLLKLLVNKILNFMIAFLFVVYNSVVMYKYYHVIYLGAVFNQ